MKILRQRLNMLIGLATPEPLLKLGAKLIGTEPELVLKSRNVIPKRLTDEGFYFEYGDLEQALKAL